MNIFIEISGESLGLEKTAETTALLDTGAGGKFIDQNYVRSQKIVTKELDTPIEVFNVDGTPNKRGTITKYARLNLTINGRTRSHDLFVTGLGKQKIILGYPWFKQNNPELDWTKRTLTWRTEQNTENTPKPTGEEEIDPESWKNHTTNPMEELDDEQIGNATLISYIEEMKSEVWINVKQGNMATELAIKENEKKPELSDEELVPEDLHEFLDVFSETKANRFPEPSVWDHKIDLKDDFEPKSFKNYNLSLEEQKELDKFLNENLEKGYIRPSQSPMASPFFFIKKKDGKLRPCQDYRYLNDGTIKNAYPLPLISEIMDKLKGAKYFSKFDVRWGYNCRNMIM